MTDTKRSTGAAKELEALSALMDGEVQPLELRRLLPQLERDDALRARWSRMHRARDALAGAGLGVLDIDVSEGVRNALSAHPGQDRGGWRRSFASFGVAASVAAAVLLTVPRMSEQPPGDVNPVAVGAPVGLVNSLGAVPVQASFGSPPTSVPGASPYGELARDRLRRFEIDHDLQAILNSPVVPPADSSVSAERLPEAGER